MIISFSNAKLMLGLQSDWVELKLVRLRYGPQVRLASIGLGGIEIHLVHGFAVLQA